MIVVCATGGAILIGVTALLYWRAKRAETRFTELQQQYELLQDPGGAPAPERSNAEDRAKENEGRSSAAVLPQTRVLELQDMGSSGDS